MTVEELLTKKGINFKPSGRDFVIKCINPEHDDNDPSMRVDSILGIFHCLSCGYKGNLFYFFGEKADKLGTLRETLNRQMDDIRSSSIGLKIPDLAEFITDSYRVSASTLKEFEAFRCIHGDYSGRIVFPIRDLKGKITCFIGRAEDPFDKVRYKVIPSKSKLPLFPLHKVKPEASKVVLVEGLFDMLNLWDNGFRNVLCTFGTNTITKDKLQLLTLLGISGIDIMFDPDDPGQEAAEKVKELAEDLYFKVRNINLKDVDPGDLTPQRAVKLKERLYG
jgi:DNA primase